MDPSSDKHFRSPFSLSSKNALVLGASQGIGRAIAISLAEAGANLLIASRQEPELEKVAAATRQLGVECHVCRFDISEPEDINKLLEKARSSYDRIDILVNCIGINPKRISFEQTDKNISDLIFKVNLFGAMDVIQAIGKIMINQKKGAIINVTSTAALHGAPTLAPYAASKAALQSLTRTLALEWAQYGVRVNDVAPGYVHTELTHKVWSNSSLYKEITNKIPMRRFALPEEISPAVVFLASDASSYITGSTLVVDGGWTT
ncbi:MAG: SDR family oxidoreductase [Anaerolineaceae bacterium]|nr:SDR family oxidoreductase [Anaerolineaceae bacterium]